MNDTPILPTAELFEPLLHSEFTLLPDEQDPFTVELIEVTRLTSPPARDDVHIRKDPFSLIFKAGDEVPMEQGTYRVEHAQIGSMGIFLVPVGFNEFQAIFN